MHKLGGRARRGSCSASPDEIKPSFRTECYAMARRQRGTCRGACSSHSR